MKSNPSFQDTVNSNEPWVLGLPSEPDKPRIFWYPAFERTLVMLTNLVNGHDALHVVAGEQGSGKTALLAEFLRQSGKPYCRCRITVSDKRRNGRHIPIAAMDRQAFLLRFGNAPVVLLDDAHTLDGGQLEYLLRAAESAVRRGQIRSLVLFGRLELSRNVQSCRPSGVNADVINTLYLRPLNETETEAYLQFRFVDSYDGESFRCSSRQVRTIHKTLGGMPGQIDLLVAQGMEPQSKGRNIWRRLSLPGVFRGLIGTPAMAGST